MTNRPPLMTLSDAAAEHVRGVIARAPSPVAGLRVGLKKGGCAGMEYVVELADAARPGDEVISDKGVTVLIEPAAVLYLIGSRMDYKSDKFSSGFVFDNPNQTSACGCGESVALTPASVGS